MKKTKLLISILLITCMLLSLCSCMQTDADQDGENTVSEVSPGTVVRETEYSITVVDQAYREVTVPKDIESIALCYRVVIRFLLSLDQGEKITGIGKTEDFLFELEPGLKNCAEVGKGVADIEALAELDPDIFFHKAGDVKTLEAVEKIGIPAVGINIETPGKMREALYVMGKFMGSEDKVDEIIEYYDNKLDKFSELRSGIDPSEQKTAIIMGSSLGSVADATMLQGKMIEYAGGINAAQDIKATELWPIAGIEQIFKWDPEYIFISNSDSATYKPEDILNNPDWQELTAVKNKHVYVMPAAKDSWEFPGTVSLLGMEYMMKMMYPDLVTESDLEMDVNELYELSYGKTFTRDELGY